jgi:general secretion pathway protein G
MKRRRQQGMSLVELIVAFTILLVLSTMAVPLARVRVRVEKERDLRAALREIHAAVDKYKDYCDSGYLGPMKAGTNCWPESLEQLVEGVKLANSPDGKKIKFLRRIPRDPFTGKYEWGLRSDQDDPKAMSWGGQDVFSAYSKTYEKAPDGTAYSEW